MNLFNKSEINTSRIKANAEHIHQQDKLQVDASDQNFTSERELNSEISDSIQSEKPYCTNEKMKKFDFFIERLNQIPELKIDYDYMKQNFILKIDHIPTLQCICDIYQKIYIKNSVTPKIKKNWNEEETMLFIWIILHYCHLNQIDFSFLKDLDWISISDIIPGKNPDQCKYKWQSLLKVNLSKIPWTKKEDDILINIVNKKGNKQWKEIAKELNTMTDFKHYRHGKQCRERWINHLDPSIKRSEWSIQEDIKLLKLQLNFGKKWADIAKKIGSRTENSVKNRWNSLIRKYRNEFGIQNDQKAAEVLLHKSSNYPMHVLEKKICLMVIEAKEREINPEKIDNHTNLRKIEEFSTSQKINNKNNHFLLKNEEEEYLKEEPLCKKKLKKCGISNNNLSEKSKNSVKDLIYQNFESFQREKQKLNQIELNSPCLLANGDSNTTQIHFITSENPLFNMINNSDSKAALNMDYSNSNACLFSHNTNILNGIPLKSMENIKSSHISTLPANNNSTIDVNIVSSSKPFCKNEFLDKVYNESNKAVSSIPINSCQINLKKEEEDLSKNINELNIKENLTALEHGFEYAKFLDNSSHEINIPTNPLLSTIMDLFHQKIGHINWVLPQNRLSYESSFSNNAVNINRPLINSLKYQNLIHLNKSIIHSMANMNLSTNQINKRLIGLDFPKYFQSSNLALHMDNNYTRSLPTFKLNYELNTTIPLLKPSPIQTLSYVNNQIRSFGDTNPVALKDNS